jgi:hypothetical protein
MSSSDSDYSFDDDADDFITNSENAKQEYTKLYQIYKNNANSRINPKNKLFNGTLFDSKKVTTNFTLLMLAIFEPNLVFYELLEKCSVEEINAVNSRGFTALMFAAHWHLEDKCLFLLQRGASTEFVSLESDDGDDHFAMIFTAMGLAFRNFFDCANHIENLLPSVKILLPYCKSSKSFVHTHIDDFIHGSDEKNPEHQSIFIQAIQQGLNPFDFVRGATWSPFDEFEGGEANCFDICLFANKSLYLKYLLLNCCKDVDVKKECERLLTRLIKHCGINYQGIIPRKAIRIVVKMGHLTKEMLRSIEIDLSLGKTAPIESIPVDFFFALLPCFSGNRKRPRETQTPSQQKQKIMEEDSDGDSAMSQSGAETK